MNTTHNETDKVVLSDGEQINLAFPSLREVKKLSNLLGIDLFADGLKKVRYGSILLDENKPFEIMKVCLGEEITADILEKITPSDFDLIITAFFFRAKTASVNLSGELNVLRNFTDQGSVLARLNTIPSTSPSSQPQMESRTE